MKQDRERCQIHNSCVRDSSTTREPILEYVGSVIEHSGKDYQMRILLVGVAAILLHSHTLILQICTPRLYDATAASHSILFTGAMRQHRRAAEVSPNLPLTLLLTVIPCLQRWTSEENSHHCSSRNQLIPIRSLWAVLFANTQKPRENI